MTLTIELPKDLEAALEARARERGFSPAIYARRVLVEALAPRSEQAPKPKKSAYGLLAKYGPGPSEKEIDQNRKEMFRGFAEDVP